MLSMDQGSMLSYGRPKPKALNFPNIGTEVWTADNIFFLVF
jgi:hypothetical protein